MPRHAIFDTSNKKVKIFWSSFGCSWLIIAIVLIAVSLKKLSPTEYGVEYDRWTKTLDEAAKAGGLHLGPVGYRFVKFPSTQITSNFADTCVSRDGLRVGYQVTFQYSLEVKHMTEVVEKYRDFQTWGTVAESAATSAVQHTCSEYNVTNFQAMRNQIQSTMFDKTKDKLSSIRALANSLQLSNIDLPSEYKSAVSEKQRAVEDIALAINQRIQETTKANTELLAAEEEAKKIMENAFNTANITITQANLKAEETEFAFSKEKEVLVQAQTTFGLDNNGLLSYTATQMYASTSKLSASVGEPSKISRKDEL
mmetsp:Transcript_3697/g.5574  ORF Transcript_3697/g.5574 Transcript_3697/m.5574 type:complete len:311 (+) Transcript_3697:102-1034(+)|eukprot:CAMPEP_0197244694 /NCGR_PEP_ID=MMETSP1429-20130617/9732_1 /TAXON_ID=49237 /ORGANISM="Chaetoceros  sp., Strain UNC1202" /LENGTH=310 /DNA_ID=CAMNT_0042705091 /DNA_START=79 /DNA_END=1011 /DNA_ORIENTATION=-